MSDFYLLRKAKALQELCSILHPSMYVTTITSSFANKKGGVLGRWLSHSHVCWTNTWPWAWIPSSHIEESQGMRKGTETSQSLLASCLAKVMWVSGLVKYPVSQKEDNNQGNHLTTVTSELYSHVHAHMSTCNACIHTCTEARALPCIHGDPCGSGIKELP